MFWGLIMEPLKRYSQVVGKSFHISQAALDTTTGDNEPCQVMVVIDGQNYLVCTLQKGKTIQTQLDLNFKRGESIAFIANGKCHVHLTGYLDLFDELDDEDGEEEEEEEDEEVPELVNVNSKKAKRKLDGSIENEKSSKKFKEDKKKVQEDSSDEDSLDSDVEDDSDDGLKKLLEDSDDDGEDADDSYKPNSSKDDVSEEGSEEEDDVDLDELNEEDDSSADEKPTPKKEEKQLSKKEKKKLKKQQQQQQQQGTPQQNGHAEKKKDKGNKENAQQKGDASPGSAQKEKKVLTGNVAIEDLVVGQGPVAKPGKMLQVYYDGKLKSNNKSFDNCQKGPGFKFRLGKNEVIRGWDIGVAGMKVGGKRRIVCPPGMAYGNKGSPPVIPPNSTLVFDVELRGVN